MISARQPASVISQCPISTRAVVLAEFQADPETDRLRWTQKDPPTRPACPPPPFHSWETSRPLVYSRVDGHVWLVRLWQLYVRMMLMTGPDPGLPSYIVRAPIALYFGQFATLE
jgi:hypothetical protein